MVIIVTDGVGEGNPSKVTTFLLPWSSQDGCIWCTPCPTSMWLTRAKCCCSKEVHQHPLYPLMVLPFSLSRCEHSLWGHFFHPIPIGLVMSAQITPLLWHWGSPATGGGRGGAGSVYLLAGSFVQSSEEENHLSNLILLSTLYAHQEEDNRMEEGLGFHPALKGLQDINQARVQLECELAQETWRLAQRCDKWQIKLAREHGRSWAQMAKEADATFQEVFSQANLTNSIKLLPWCVSSTFPFHYMSEVLATTMQQNEDIPATITVPKLEGSLALGPSNSPAYQTGTLPLPVPPLPDIPFVGTPQVGLCFAWFIASPTQKKQDYSSSG